MESPLAAYQKLVERLDLFSAQVSNRFPEAMKCVAGCDDCCQRDISVYVFEVEILLQAANLLPPEDMQSVVERATRILDDPEAPCSLLQESCCLLYSYRPVLCRTHGLPLLVPVDGSLSVCPYNFVRVEHIDGDCVLNLEPVNQILATVNHLVVVGAPSGFERKSLGLAIVEHFSGGTNR
jgi:hypothetical protein